MAHAAQVLIGLRQILIIALLGIDLLFQKLRPGAQLRHSGRMPQEHDQRKVRRHAQQDAEGQIPAVAEVGADIFRGEPARQQHILADGKEQQQKPLPGPYQAGIALLKAPDQERQDPQQHKVAEKVDQIYRKQRGKGGAHHGLGAQLRRQKHKSQDLRQCHHQQHGHREDELFVPLSPKEQLGDADDEQGAEKGAGHALLRQSLGHKGKGQKGQHHQRKREPQAKAGRKQDRKADHPHQVEDDLKAYIQKGLFHRGPPIFVRLSVARGKRASDRRLSV